MAARASTVSLEGFFFLLPHSMHVARHLDACNGHTSGCFTSGATTPQKFRMPPGHQHSKVDARRVPRIMYVDPAQGLDL